MGLGAEEGRRVSPQMAPRPPGSPQELMRIRLGYEALAHHLWVRRKALHTSTHLSLACVPGSQVSTLTLTPRDPMRCDQTGLLTDVSSQQGYSFFLSFFPSLSFFLSFFFFLSLFALAPQLQQMGSSVAAGGLLSCGMQTLSCSTYVGSSSLARD